MGRITQKIREIQLQEDLTLVEVFRKYPHLAQMQYEELQEEKNRVTESKERKLLCD
jgi:hypothetical protein